MKNAQLESKHFYKTLKIESTPKISQDCLQSRGKENAGETV